VGLTVRDLDGSAEWYERVLEAPPDDEGIPPALLLLHPDSGFLVALCGHRDRSGDRFSPHRTGLDHIALEVSDEDQLARWIAELDALGVEHSPVRDLGHSRFVSLEDPDGIQLELWLTITPPRPE
jgi:catechol 2,3-dioxygenase-like lactoylglutathione lyase family enzyme